VRRLPLSSIDDHGQIVTDAAFPARSPAISLSTDMAAQGAGPGRRHEGSCHRITVDAFGVPPLLTLLDNLLFPALATVAPAAMDIAVLLP
jgi:hypothetical protein